MPAFTPGAVFAVLVIHQCYLGCIIIRHVRDLTRGLTCRRSYVTPNCPTRQTGR